MKRRCFSSQEQKKKLYYNIYFTPCEEGRIQCTDLDKRSLKCSESCFRLALFSVDIIDIVVVLSLVCLVRVMCYVAGYR